MPTHRAAVLLVILVSVSTLGCHGRTLLVRDMPGPDTVLLLTARADIYEKWEFNDRDPTGDRVVAWSADRHCVVEGERLLVEVGAPGGVRYPPQRQKLTRTAEELLSAGIVVCQSLTDHAGIGGASAAAYVADDPRGPLPIRPGYPGDRFDGLPPEPYRDDRLTIHEAGEDSTVTMSLNADR